MQHKNIDSLCLTKECLSATLHLQTMMDTTTEPCYNFYQFSCGGWIKNNFIPTSRDEWNITYDSVGEIRIKLRTLLERPIENGNTDSVERKVKVMYQRCLDEDVIDDDNNWQRLREFIKNIGGWAVTGISLSIVDCARLNTCTMYIQVFLYTRNVFLPCTNGGLFLSNKLHYFCDSFYTLLIRILEFLF